MLAIQVKERIAEEKAVEIAQDFIADQLGNLIGPGRPYHMVSGLQAVWSIPLVLTSPGYGIVGVVGGVMVDIEFGHIVGWTPLDEVRANATALATENEAQLDHAFTAYRNGLHQAHP